jgi:hypothetical protein
MAAKSATTEPCVHCLCLSESMTSDHGLPQSWYPDTTPETVQRWTAPSCAKCNGELGRLEKDPFISTVLCIDPRKEGVSGLAAKALRSLGIDARGVSESAKAYRDRLRAKIRAELMPYEDVAKGPGAIPGLGPHENTQWGVPIPWASLSILAAKIARVSEHWLRRRFVEAPYSIRTSVSDDGVVPAPLVPYVEVFDFGPGFRISRMSPREDRLNVRYALLDIDLGRDTSPRPYRFGGRFTERGPRYFKR